MGELVEKLGIDWRLLLAQGANFILILLILRFSVYKPLLNMLRKRREKIEQGLEDAETAKKHLAEADSIREKKIAESEKESLELFKRAEVNAKQQENKLLAEARLREKEILHNADIMASQKQREMKSVVFEQAAQMVQEAVERIAAKKPLPIDSALVEQVVKELKPE